MMAKNEIYVGIQYVCGQSYGPKDDVSQCSKIVSTLMSWVGLSYLSNLIQSYPILSNRKTNLRSHELSKSVPYQAELFLRDALFFGPAAQATELTVRIRSWQTDWEARARASFFCASKTQGMTTYHLVMTNIAMENPNHKWRFLAGKIISKFHKC